MGDLNTQQVSETSRLSFTRALLDDLKALEIMLEKGVVESGISRIGAEQEFCLVNEQMRPSDQSIQILEAINDEHFTTELAKFNLEINLDPQELNATAFERVENQLMALLNKAKAALKNREESVILTGILPTISTNEIKLDYMTPMPRYFALNQMLTTLRGSDFRLNLFGVDELSLKHDSVMFEACNTSFQLHLQIDPDDFIKSFNWAQAIAGPVLSACVNSPMLLGRELWSETRIALFQQSIDTRGVSKALKDQPSRVAFGDAWAKGSVVDLYKNEITRHKIILSQSIEENSLDTLQNGGIPKLKAISLYNGTIYNWNRPCYGVGNGKAHLRIENRYIPSGPTVKDQMANFAFWVGLMKGRTTEGDKVHELMDFKDAKSNFIKAARYGTESIMSWYGEAISAPELIEQKLISIAAAGLKSVGLNDATIQQYLNVILQRVKKQTGAQWMVNQYRELKRFHKQDDALVALTKKIYENQQEEKPVHTWSVDPAEESLHYSPKKVGQIMTTQLYTAYAEDTAELTLNIMHWKNIHHLPIVDKNGALVGVLTASHVRKYRTQNSDFNPETTVSEIMVKALHTATNTTLISDAVELMKTNEIGCLPVLQKGHLVGIITIEDVIKFANA